MKHLKLFEEHTEKDLENAMKPIVDWDEFEYLQYKLTEYEDAGKFVRVDICIKKLGKGEDDHEYQYFYKYSDGEGIYRTVYNSHVVSNYVSAAKNHGLYYRVYVHEAADDKNGSNTTDMMNQFIEDIKDRFNEPIIEDGFHGKCIMLKSNPDVSRETKHEEE